MSSVWHVKFKDATIYNKKVTRVEVELFNQPSYNIAHYSHNEITVVIHVYPQKYNHDDKRGWTMK